MTPLTSHVHKTHRLTIYYIDNRALELVNRALHLVNRALNLNRGDDLVNRNDNLLNNRKSRAQIF